MSKAAVLLPHDDPTTLVVAHHVPSEWHLDELLHPAHDGHAGPAEGGLPAADPHVLLLGEEVPAEPDDADEALALLDRALTGLEPHVVPPDEAALVVEDVAPVVVAPDGEPFAKAEPAPLEPVPDLDTLVTSHLPLVGHLVNDRLASLPGHVRRDDLLSAGYTALVAAARGFDPAKGVPFARYATLRIRGALVDELRGADWASRSVRAAARRQQSAHDELAHTLGRPPTRHELAHHLGVDPEALAANNADVARAQVLSTDGLGPDFDLADMLPDAAPTPEQELEARERIGFLRDAVAELPGPLRTVIEGYFCAERPMAEIAAELGVTASRVSQLRAEALALLKDAINVHLDPERVAAPARPTGCVARRRAAYFAAVANRSDYRTRLNQSFCPSRAA